MVLVLSISVNDNVWWHHPLVLNDVGAISSFVSSLKPAVWHFTILFFSESERKPVGGAKYNPTPNETSSGDRCYIQCSWAKNVKGLKFRGENTNDPGAGQQRGSNPSITYIVHTTQNNLQQQGLHGEGRHQVNHKAQKIGAQSFINSDPQHCWTVGQRSQREYQRRIKPVEITPLTWSHTFQCVVVHVVCSLQSTAQLCFRSTTQLLQGSCKTSALRVNSRFVLKQTAAFQPYLLFFFFIFSPCLMSFEKTEWFHMGKPTASHIRL